MDNNQILAELSQGAWKGYLWMSDAQKPVVYAQPSAIDASLLAPGLCPFVIEGRLVNSDGTRSVSIANVDGQVLLSAFDIPQGDANSDEYERVVFRAHRLDGVRNLCFYRHWSKTSDEFCQGWDVLTPAELIFTGFDIPNWANEAVKEGER